MKLRITGGQYNSLPGAFRPSMDQYRDRQITRQRALLVIAVILLGLSDVEGREIRLSSVAVRLTDLGDHYGASVNIETIMDETMVAREGWQLYHMHTTVPDNRPTNYQIPVQGSFQSRNLDVSIGSHTNPSSSVQSELRGASRTREMRLYYSYSVADQISRSGISLTHDIDTARTQANGIPLERLSAEDTDIIKLFVGEDDAGQQVLWAGDEMELECSYMSKYEYLRQFTWERVSLDEALLSVGTDPLQYVTLARSMPQSRSRDLEHVEEGYSMNNQEIRSDGRTIFTTTLQLESFDPSTHAGLYHCSIQDYSMLTGGQPWLVTIDRFFEVRASGDGSPLLPSIHPTLPMYVDISTCSQREPDVNGIVWMTPTDPDCIMCTALGQQTPTLSRNGHEIPWTLTWPLTIRNPYLHIVYTVVDQPHSGVTGLYRCSSGLGADQIYSEISVGVMADIAIY